jgi:hypothetical protein
MFKKGHPNLAHHHANSFEWNWAAWLNKENVDFHFSLLQTAHDMISEFNGEPITPDLIGNLDEVGADEHSSRNGYIIGEKNMKLSHTLSAGNQERVSMIQGATASFHKPVRALWQRNLAPAPRGELEATVDLANILGP